MKKDSSNRVKCTPGVIAQKTGTIGSSAYGTALFEGGDFVAAGLYLNVIFCYTIGVDRYLRWDLRFRVLMGKINTRLNFKGTRKRK